MLADSAEGARREVPQLMQVGRHEMRMIRVRWSDRCGSRKGELVIMMLERVAPQLMRVRRKKWVGTSSSRVITSNGIKDFRERQIQIQRQERSGHGIQHFNV